MKLLIDFSVTANIAFDKGTIDGEISPGKKMVGYYSVEVPSTTSKIEIEMKPEITNNSKAVFSFDVPK